LIAGLLHIDWFLVEKFPITVYRELTEESANLMNGLAGGEFEVETPADRQFRDEMDYLRVKHKFEATDDGTNKD